MIPEFRVYYNEQGKILFYSCEKHEGNYIVVTKDEYAEGRPELLVIDGKLTRPNNSQSTIKLVPDVEGMSCAVDDVSIVTTTGNTQKWKLKVNEF